MDGEAMTGEQAFEDVVAQLMQARRPSVWDARRLLRGAIGRRLDLVIDDGQHARSPREGVLVDVVHTPDLGFALKLKKFGRPGQGRRQRRPVSLVPLSLLRDPLPAEVAFLAAPPDLWPWPADTTVCPGCTRKSAGRFCVHCGRKARKGHHLGRRFSAEQVALRDALAGGAHGVVPHSCGALLAGAWSYCPKCGLAP
jgi:hypothetical protein